jgi:hypothetical protein
MLLPNMHRYKGTAYWESCYWRHQVVASDTDSQAVTMNQDAQGHLTDHQEEILAIKLLNLPAEVTTAICTVLVFEQDFALEDAIGSHACLA